MQFKNDIRLTPDGDLLIDRTWLFPDLALVQDLEYVKQTITHRLKSVSSEWVGADLEQFIGEPNSKETADKIIANITSILTSDGLLKQDEVYVKAKPINKTEVYFFVFIKNPYGGDTINFLVQIDYQIGTQVLEV